MKYYDKTINLIINYICLECGFNGEVAEKYRKIECPQCKTINDVWLENEEIPLRHR